MSTFPDEPIFVQDNSDKDYAEKLLLGIKENYATLLVGPTGVGKTAIVKWVASQLNWGYRRIQLTGSIIYKYE